MADATAKRRRSWIPLLGMPLLLVGCAATAGTRAAAPGGSLQVAGGRTLPYAPVVDRLEEELRAHGTAATSQALERLPHLEQHLLLVRGSDRMHRHTTGDLAASVLAGRGRLHHPRGETELRAGSAVLVPQEAPHAFASAAGERLLLLVTFAPPSTAPIRAPRSEDSPER